MKNNKKIVQKKDLINISPNSKLFRIYKNQLPPLNIIQKEVLIGIILGDINMRKESKNGNFKLRFCLSYKNKDYGYHLYNLFKDYIIQEPKIRERKNINNNIIKYIEFQTISHENFNFYGNLFYIYISDLTSELFLEYETSIKNRKTIKIFKENTISNYLTPRGLAYWFMDDGGKMDYSKNNGKGLVLNTHNFAKKEVEYMILELKKKWNLNCWLGLNKNRHIIKISGKDFEKILDLINPYIIKSMRYKLPTERKKKKNII